MDNFVDYGENYAGFGNKLKKEPVFCWRNCDIYCRGIIIDRFGLIFEMQKAPADIVKKC